MKRYAWVAAILVVVGLGGLGLAYSGQYSVAADEPHWGITTRALAVIRDRSIAVRAADLKGPDLADPALIALGAEHYAGMCVGCHLAPGQGDSAVRSGLYPMPPDLTKPGSRGPAESFWIIKHGLKMSGMPAWGVTHNDESIWGLVAFLQQLPTLDAAAYSAITGGAAIEGHDHDEHQHDAHDHASDGEVQAEGATMSPAAESGHAHAGPAGEVHAH